MSDLLLVWMSPSVSPSPSEPSPSCWAVVVLMAPVLELTLPGPAGWPSTVVSPYALLRPDTEEETHAQRQMQLNNKNARVVNNKEVINLKLSPDKFTFTLHLRLFI